MSCHRTILLWLGDEVSPESSMSWSHVLASLWSDWIIRYNPIDGLVSYGCDVEGYTLSLIPLCSVFLPPGYHDVGSFPKQPPYTMIFLSLQGPKISATSQTFTKTFEIYLLLGLMS